jgi:UDP-glucose 4-epimerase
MAVCLVTGGAGFLGSHVADALIARGDVVRVLDDFSSGTLDNLAHARDAIEIVNGDLNEPDVLERAVHDVEYVFHFISPPCERLKGHEPVPVKWAHATDTLNLLVAARQAKVRRVIFASSGSVYGAGTSGEFRESDPMMPISPSGFAKQSAENQCAGFTMLHGLETVRLRFFQVFGPRQSPATVHAPLLPIIIQTMLAGQCPAIADSPFEQQDFLYISDAVHATLLAATATRVAGKAYNIARGRSASLVQVVGGVNKILNTNLQPIFSPTRPPEEPCRAVSISRAEAELGFCPTNDLKQGLTRFVEYLRGQAPADISNSVADAALTG